jgi:DUF1680 family protein
MPAETKNQFWSLLYKQNAEVSIFHQWEQLEETGCIRNFRITAGLSEGFREGYFFADSDAYKWLEAASLILAEKSDPELKRIVDDFIILLEKAQEDDGYLYTYNQIHFKGVRWKNLQVEHEFYCLGHLIEAGVSHFEATGETRLLIIARRVADLLVKNFLHASPVFTDGHEEIEIALLRLSRVTGDPGYAELARHFLDSRGRVKGFGFQVLQQTLSMLGRMRTVGVMRREYTRSHPGYTPVSLPAHNQHLTPPFTPLRFLFSLVSGKYAQQQAPIIQQEIPEGHAVRFAYLQTATAMVLQEEPDPGQIARLERTWERMTARRMYVTGGIGSLPLVEGFGRDYELNPEVAYAETCAALGSMLWNREMTRLTGKPRYADLLEWQFFNAARVGVSVDGKGYFYNNPLVCAHGHQRASWYDIPCCPSNLSRVMSSLHKMVLRKDRDGLTIDLYIPGKYDIGNEATLTIETSLPWEGEVKLDFYLPKNGILDLILRVPAWADQYAMMLNGAEIESDEGLTDDQSLESSVDLHFEDARYVKVRQTIRSGDQLVLRFSMPFRCRRQDPRLPGCGGKVALTHGPLVYCLESVDNTSGIFDLKVDPASLSTHFDPDLLGGTQLITGKSNEGANLTWIPYMYWGNRGGSRMNLFFSLVER